MASIPSLTAIERNSVQVLPDAQRDGGAPAFFWETARGPILPAWGTRERERALRVWYRNQYNTLIQGAFAGLTKRWAATPWEISGPRRATKTFQDMFRAADFGRGWSSFVQKMALDFLRQDGGAYVEVIAPGNPMKAPTGPAMALANLDSLRCMPTGDPEYPVVYYNRQGAMHLLHRARVIHLVDMPDSDERNPGYGLSALSRAIAIAERQALMAQYVRQRLDDKPLPGLNIISGVTKNQLDDAFRNYRRTQDTDGEQVFGRAMWMNNLQPDQPVQVESVQFSSAPDNFDYATYTEIDVNELALAIGVDKQELWELGGGDLGSGAQSEVLHAKSQGKTFGAFLIELERRLNDVLPEACEFTFKVQDPYEAVERAQSAQVWAGVIAALGDKLTPDEARLLLANQIEAVKDAITDADGALIRLNDADPKADPQAPQIVAGDATPVDAAPAAAPVSETTADSMKAIGATRLDFETDLEALLGEARAGSVDRRRFPILMRSIIRRQSLKAYQDGLIDGGVADGQMDEEDDAQWTALYADASAYVGDFWRNLYDGAGISDAQAGQRPVMWWNKSLQPFYDAARASADKNGAYEWVLGATEEHCTDCLAMNGQVHRLKEYVKRGVMPQADILECKGFNCGCQLVKTDARSRGRFLKGA